MRPQTLQVRLHAVDQMTKPLRAMQMAVGGFAKHAESSISRVERRFNKLRKGMSSSFGGFGGLGIGFLGFQAVDNMMQFETGLVAVKKTAGLTGDQYVEMGNKILETSKKMKTISAVELTRYATIGGQAGIDDVDDLALFAKSIGMLKRAAPDMDAEFGASSISKIMGITGDDTDNVNNFTSALVNLGNKTKGNEQDILEQTLKIVQKSGVYKLKSSDALGLGASFANMGMQADAAATAVSKTFDALDVAAAGGGNLSLFAKITDMTPEEFRKAFDTRPMEVFQKFIENVGDSKRFGNQQELLKGLTLSELRTKTGIRMLSLVEKGVDEAGEPLLAFTKIIDMSRKAYEEHTAAQIEFSESQNTVASALSSVGIQFLNVFNSAALNTGSFSVLSTVLYFVANNMEALVSVSLVLIAVWATVRASIFAINVVLGIQVALSKAHKGALIGNIVAQRAYIVATWLRTAAMFAFNAVMLASKLILTLFTGGFAAMNAVMMANPIGLVIAAIVLLIAAVASVIYYWDEWGMKVMSVVAMFIPVGNIIASVVRNWELVKTSFQDGGFLTGMKAIFFTLADIVMTPLIYVLELFDKVAGTDYAGKVSAFKSEWETKIENEPINSEAEKAKKDLETRQEQKGGERSMLDISFGNMPQGLGLDFVDGGNGVTIKESF